MITKKRSKKDLFKAIFGSFLVIIGLFVGVFGTVLGSNMVYAEPGASEEGTGDNSDSGEAADENETTDDNTDENETTNDNTDENEEPSDSDESSETHSILGTEALSPTVEEACKNALGEIKWLACPATGAVANAVNWLYDKIEGALEVEPAPMEDGSPIYEIWKYCLSVTNVVFVIFLLVVIYSQLTGIGISNYGVKKVLPKLIITAILVNLSFLVCSLAVDVSNMVGNGLRGVFETVESSVMANSAAEMSTEDIINARIAKAKSYSSMAGVPALALLGGVVAFETGAIWMLIPVLLGAVVAVVSGLVTIALRQAVVALLIMISPLAIVACILPNTEKWFKKWEDLLIKMLVFYPMFSLLFGASSLAGFAIAASAKGDEFGILLGTAVQIFPLFFSWNLMKMSGTFLGTINAKMRSLAAKPLATNRAWAESHRALSRARHLERNYTPSARLMNFLAYRKVSRESELSSLNERMKAEYMAKNDARDYDSEGRLSRRGQMRYNRQALTMRYMQFSQMHKDNLEEGFSEHSSEYRRTIAEMRGDLFGSSGVYTSAIQGGSYEERIKSLDMANMNAADDLKAEIARGAEIEYKNARGFFDRALKAKFANDDDQARRAGDIRHQMHPGALDANGENLARYNRWKRIMEGRDDGTQTVLADAASSLSAQAQIRRGKFQVLSELTPATQNVADHIDELIESDAVKNIDAILGGLRVLNMRGDTDLEAELATHRLMDKLGGIEAGTYTSQAIANFTMFEVKDKDPTLRRFGKYINMQTAAIYNDNDPEKRRVRKDISWWEYINGEYVEQDEDGNTVYDNDGNPIIKKTKGAVELLRGTSYSNVERTAFKSQRERIRAAAHEIGPDGEVLPEFSVERYLDKMDEIYDSILPNLIGDHFSYRSGSEQIMAFIKDLTGLGKNHKWDWEYIFGEEITPTLKQKAGWIMRSRDLIKKFLGGQVSSQIGRSKSDVLKGIQNAYALFDEVMTIDNRSKEEVVDLAKLEALEGREFTDDDGPDSYKSFLKEGDSEEGREGRSNKIKKRLQASYKENALKSFAKQIGKGYQGEAKELLFELLDPEELYKRYFPSGNKVHKSTQSQDDKDDDDGMPITTSLGGGMSNDGIHNDTREEIQEKYEEYMRSDKLDVNGFWNDVSDILESSAEMGDLRVDMNRFGEGVPQYTDVHQLYNDILRKFFGSE